MAVVIWLLGVASRVPRMAGRSRVPRRTYRAKPREIRGSRRPLRKLRESALPGDVRAAAASARASPSRPVYAATAARMSKRLRASRRPDRPVRSCLGPAVQLRRSCPATSRSACRSRHRHHVDFGATIDTSQPDGLDDGAGLVQFARQARIGHGLRWRRTGSIVCVGILQRQCALQARLIDALPVEERRSRQQRACPTDAAPDRHASRRLHTACRAFCKETSNSPDIACAKASDMRVWTNIGGMAPSLIDRTFQQCGSVNEGVIRDPDAGQQVQCDAPKRSGSQVIDRRFQQRTSSVHITRREMVLRSSDSA